MDSILQFEQIGDYLSQSNIRVPQAMDDFIIYSYDDVNDDADFSLKAYRNNYYEMAFELTEGCSYQVDEFQFPLERQRLAIISPGRLQSFAAHDESSSEEIKGYGVLFSRDFMSAHLNENRLFRDYPFLKRSKSPAIYPETNRFKEMQSLFETIRYEYQEYGQQSKDVIRSYIRAILEKATQSYPKNEHTGALTREEEITVQFESLCNSKMCEYTTVKEYAEVLNLSAKHLSDVVKKVTGRRALEIINSARMAEAKSLLIHTNTTLAEIAFNLQFATTDYFITFFKHHTGATPTQFRLFQS